MIAGELLEEHVGMTISYGPNGMFTGVLETVHYLEKEPAAVHLSTAKMHITTSDRRHATLALEEEIVLHETKGTVR